VLPQDCQPSLPQIPPPEKALIVQNPLFELIQVIALVVQFDLTGFWLAA